MVPLLFGNRAYPIDELQSLDKVRELKRLGKMVLIHHLPPAHLRCEFFEFRPAQRRYPSPARHAMLFRQTHKLYFGAEFRPAVRKRVPASTTKAVPRLSLYCSLFAPPMAP